MTTCLAAGVRRFVFVSTGLVYGAGSQHPAREDDPPSSSTLRAYPASKRAAEDDSRALHRDVGFDVRIARLGFVYGDGDPHVSEIMMAKRHPAFRLHMVHHLDVAQNAEKMHHGSQA